MSRTLTIVIDDDGTTSIVTGGEFSTGEVMNIFGQLEKAYVDRFITEEIQRGVKEALKHEPTDS